MLHYQVEIKDKIGKSKLSVTHVIVYLALIQDHINLQNIVQNL